MIQRAALAIWAAVRRACSEEDFRPKPGPQCGWCGFHAYCPAQGGDLSLVPREATGPNPATVQLSLEATA